jgi:hypothetical protein
MLTYKELQEKGICWPGYKRKKGTKPYEDGSCVKESIKSSGVIKKSNHKVIAFGRMNPPTIGHEQVVNKVHEIAKKHGGNHVVILSHSHDPKKNPLSPEQKVKHAKNGFPGTNIESASKEHPTILHHAAEIHSTGVEHLHVVAGSDRHEEMHNLLHKYNGQHAAHGHYNFKSITVHSSGERDADSEGASGMSASKMREHAASGNKTEFHKGAPPKMKPEHKDAMYNDVRKGMNLKEETMDQQADRAAQLKRFKDQMTKGNGPKIDPELALDKKEKAAMGVKEHLDANAGAGAWINDFISSTNPRFNNKSKSERRKMAIGAYMAAKAKDMKEEVNHRDLASQGKMHPIWADHMEVGHHTDYYEHGTGDKVEGKVIHKDKNEIHMKQTHDSYNPKKVGTVHKFKISDKLDEATKSRRMSAAVKLHRAFERERAKSTASNERERMRRELQGISDRMKPKEEVKEGTLQGNVAGGDAMNTTTSAPSDKMPAGSVKKVKGFKFFNGTNEPNTQMTVKEEKKDDVPFDGPYTSSFKKPNNPNRTGMDSARSLAQRAMDQVKKKPVKEEIDQIEEGYDKSSEHHKNARKMAKDYGGKATFHPNGHAEVRMRSIVHGHSTLNPQGTTLMSGEDLANRASKEHGKGKVQGNVVHFKEANDVHEAMTGNPGSGYHGACDSPDEKYEATHKHVKNLTDADDKTVKHYLDSAHGRHLAGREEDHEYIKKDFKKFKKYYRPEMHESTEMARLDLQTIINNVNRVKPMVDKETDLPDWIESKITMAADYIKCVSDYIAAAEQIGTGLEEETHKPGSKVQKIDKKTAVIKLHPNGAASDTDEGWAKPKIKEGTMKSYKDFLQGLDEASKKKPAWLLDSELNAEKKEGKLKEAKEGSAEDKKEDKAGMKRTGMTAKEWEKSAEDKKEDMQEANWIAGAIKHPGAMTAAAKRAGETNAEYEQEHKHDSGKAGRRARLALTLKKMHEEQINELSINTLRRVHGAAVRDANDADREGDEEKANKRYNLAGKASNKVQDKLKNSSVKEENQQIDEYESDKNGVYSHTKKTTYGTSYVDPEGADETAADLKKKEKKTAGRKTGSGAGVYKPRATMSKLKQLGATYK